MVTRMLCRTLAAAALLAASAASAQEAAAPAAAPARITRGSQYERVPLEKPVALKLVPMDSHPLVRGELMTFRLVLEGAPKPITMFSARIAYTSGTLELENFRQAPKYIVDVTPAIALEPGRAAHNIGGISLAGITEGELARLTFRVPKDAPDTIRIEMMDHPLLREGLAHDEGERLLDFERRLDATATAELKVANELPAGVTRAEGGAGPRRRIETRREDPPAGS